MQNKHTLCIPPYTSTEIRAPYYTYCCNMNFSVKRAIHVLFTYLCVCKRMGVNSTLWCTLILLWSYKNLKK